MVFRIAGARKRDGLTALRAAGRQKRAVVIGARAVVFTVRAPDSGQDSASPEFHAAGRDENSSRPVARFAEREVIAPDRGLGAVTAVLRRPGDMQKSSSADAVAAAAVLPVAGHAVAAAECDAPIAGRGLITGRRVELAAQLEGVASWPDRIFAHAMLPAAEREQISRARCGWSPGRHREVATRPAPSPKPPHALRHRS
jgi:hypothetical protein